MLLPLTAQAAVACDETALVTAVTAANAAGGGTVTLTPGCTCTLTASHGDDGVRRPDGLPIITTPITFEGNANTIAHHGAITLTGSHLTGNTASGLGGATNCTGNLSPVPGCVG